MVNQDKSNIIKVLRNKIINSIEKIPTSTYELSSLLWADAAMCFPTTCSWNWDCACFKLDLQTMKLYADVSTYPNQFGACREDRYSLSAYEFHEKAKAFNMSNDLQCMETEEDWQELFDENLNSAIANAQKILNEQKEKQKQAAQNSNTIVIPHKFVSVKPTMAFDKVLIDLQQRYGSSSVMLTKESEKYVLKYCYSATYSYDRKNAQRELSPLESAWVEHQIEKCIKNPDKTTWQSMVGGDSMTVEIHKNNEPYVKLRSNPPLNKYTNLRDQLRSLAEYESFLESKNTILLLKKPLG